MLKSILKKGIWIFLGGWIVFIYSSALYFWQGVTLWRTLGENIFRIFLLALFLLINTALGKKALKWLKLERCSFLESSLFSLGLGLAIFTHLLIGLGLIGLFNQWSINLLLLGVFLLSYREIESIVQQTKVKFGNLLTSDISWVGIILVLILAIQVFFNLAGASVLPSGWDSLGVYFPRAKEWVRLHSLEAIPYINVDLVLYPFNIGMLYGMSLLVKDAILAKFIHFSFGILMVMGVYALGRKYLSSRVGLISAAIFYTIPAVAYLSTTAYVDLGYAFYAFLALYAFINWTTTDKKGWLIVSAIMSGLCVGSKYAGFLPITILALGIPFHSWLVKKEKSIIVGKNFLLFVLLAGLVGSFWYVRGFIIYGRFVPFALALGLWSGIRATFWRMLTLGPLNPENLSSALAFNFSFLRDKALIPWNLTMRGGVDYAQDPGGIGVLFLAFLPFLLLTRFRKNRVIRFILFYSLVFFIIWAIRLPVKRYLIPIFPLLSIIVAYIIIRISELRKLARTPLFILVILTLIFQMVYIAPGGLSKIYYRMLVFAGVTSQEEYIMKNEETYPVYEFINGNLSPSAKLYVMNDPRTFYCDRPYIRSILRKDGRRYFSFRRGEELLAELKKLGISYIVANQSSWEGYFGKGRYPEVLEEIRTDHLLVFYDKGPFIVFQIRY